MPSLSYRHAAATTAALIAPLVGAPSASSSTREFCIPATQKYPQYCGEVSYTGSTPATWGLANRITKLRLFSRNQSIMFSTSVNGTAKIEPLMVMTSNPSVVVARYPSRLYTNSTLINSTYCTWGTAPCFAWPELGGRSIALDVTISNTKFNGTVRTSAFDINIDNK